jgi:putative membrane protein
MKKPIIYDLSDEKIDIVETKQDFNEPIFIDEKPQSKLAAWFWSALAGLISIAIIASLTNFIEGLFAKSPLAGWIALGLSVILLLTGIIILWRELRALRQIKIIGKWHETPDVNAIYDHFKTMPAAARGLTLYHDATKSQIVDESDRLILLERHVLAPLDKSTLALIAQASKRVSMVTALSPRAIVDIAMVSFTLVTLLRKIAGVYGLRPGTLAGFKLMRLAFTHLAITAGLAAGDTIISQFLGAGIAGRLSAKLGEGVVNGLLTARFGIAAQAICRPLRFQEGSAPKLNEVVAGFLN